MAAPFLRPRGRRRGRCQGWGVTFGVGARLGASSTDPSSPCWDLWHRAGSVAAASVSPRVSKPAPLTKPEHPRRGLQGAMPRGRCLPAARRLHSAAQFLQQGGDTSGVPPTSPPRQPSPRGSSPALWAPDLRFPPVHARRSCSQPSRWPNCRRQPVPRALCAFKELSASPGSFRCEPGASFLPPRVP